MGTGWIHLESTGTRDILDHPSAIVAGPDSKDGQDWYELIGKRLLSPSSPPDSCLWSFFGVGGGLSTVVSISTVRSIP